MKSLLDIIPVIGFFVVFKFQGIMKATIVLMALSAIVMLIQYIKYKKIAKMPLISLVIIGLFGGLTLYFNDPIFIKLKPTILNGIFASILFISAYQKKPLLKLFLSHSVTLTDSNWIKLSYRFASFFCMVAILNEWVWRHYSEAFWVNFKVFGIIGLTIVFLATQANFLNQNPE